MPVSRSRALVLLPLLLWLSGPSSAASAAPQHADVRVLIDISGSMRQNDPANLRRPALRMLAGLMQPGTRAGVWTFARWVNNLVPVAEVDAAWKKRVVALSEQIASPGQFTNIEEVLDKASNDWSGPATTHSRHLLLLTDGMVDVSKDAAENARSRERILEDVLPRLREAGVRVHTVALSAEADHELMRRLAAETGGYYRQVTLAEDLQRVFLHMFETVGTPDAVPLQDNRFVVDGSISEATVLVFSRPGSPAVVLRSPAGAEYTDSDLPAGVAWYRDQGYDLITLGAPEKGEWSLQADLDPDNRVMVVTDLKLQVSEVPAHLAVDERLRVEAYLSNRGEVVERQAFLRLLEVRAEATAGDGSVSQLALNDRGEGADERGADGRYAGQLSLAAAHDEVELLLSIESPTFMRQKRLRLAVHEPLTAAVGEGADGPELDVRLQPAVMQSEVELSAWQPGEAGGRLELALVADGDGGWNAPLRDSTAPGYVEMSGTTRLGNLIERRVGPLMPPGVEPPATSLSPVERSEADSVQLTAGEAAAEPAQAVAEEPPAAAESEGGWLIPGLVFLGFNLVVLGGALTWYLLRRRGGAGGDETGLDDLLDELPEAPQPAADPDELREAAA